MSAGDQVLPATNVPNGYASPPGGPSIGAAVDMGTTQGATSRQFSLTGAPSDVVDVNDSQDGTNWTQVVRLSGGDRVVLPEIARHLRTIRQQGTTPISCQVGDLVPPAPPAPPAAAEPSKLNKGMAGLLTTADGQLACATGLLATPVGPVYVVVNQMVYYPGDGTKVGVPCYFSDDGGATARAQGSMQLGDELYWNGTVALFQIATSDLIYFYFNA